MQCVRSLSNHELASEESAAEVSLVGALAAPFAELDGERRDLEVELEN
jgi:hypothetical protein